MNKFITDNISLLNKNNIVKIKLGNKLADNMFDAKLQKKIIEDFISECKKNSINFNNTQDIYLYKYLNNYVESKNNKISYGSFRTIRYLIIDNKNIDCCISIDNNVKNDYNIQSIYNYNSQTHIKRKIYLINNLVEIHIDNNQEIDDHKNPINKNYYTINLIIKKPSNLNKTLKIIDQIFKLFSTTTKNFRQFCVKFTLLLTSIIVSKTFSPVKL